MARLLQNKIAMEPSIPEELPKAVAEILASLYTIKGT